MNLDLDTLARLAWLQIWQVTVVTIIVAVVVKCSCRKRPRLAYALWMLVVIKSIVPPLWSSPTGLFSWAQCGWAQRSWAEFDSTAAQSEVAENAPGVPVDAPAIAPVSRDTVQVARDVQVDTTLDRGTDWSRIRVAMFYLWSTGLAIGAGYVLAKQLLCAHLIRRSSLPVDERYISALRDLSRRLGVKRRVRLIVTARPIGPAAFGLFRPSILLPEALLSGTSLEQIELVLAHELVHVRRGDVLAGKLQLVAQLIWWFNPLVWWANQQAGRERERCCDEEVMSAVGCKPVLYARTLLNVLEQKARLRSLLALPGVRAMEITSLRLESIMKYAERDHRRASWISRIAFTAGLILLVPGTGITLQNRLQANEEGGGASASDAKSAQQKLQGEWKIVRCEFSGDADTEIVGVKHTIKNGKWLRPNRRTAEYGLRIHPNTGLNWIELSADRLGDRTLKGIYSLEGDTLTICYAYDPESPRPTEFKTTPDVKAYLYVLERVKKSPGVGLASKDSSPPSSTRNVDVGPEQEKLQGNWKIVRCEFSGSNEPQAVGILDEIRGNKWLRPNRRTGEYRLEIDPNKDSMSVDLSADRLGDRTLKGIYSLQGDTLKICYAYDPKLPRPTEFKTTPDVRAYLYVLERVKDQ